MGIDASNARIYGSNADMIYLAPLGTDLPTDIDEELDAAFEGVGWLSEDGIVENATGSKESIRGFQGGGVVRTTMSETGTTIEFTALETKAQTKELRYDVKSSSETQGVRTEKRGAGQKVSVRSAVVDLYDADDDSIHERLTIERLEIVPNGERTFVHSDIAGFPFESEVIGDWTSIATVPGSESSGGSGD